MATQLKNLSETTLTANKEFKKVRIGIVVSQWNEEITGALLQGAIDFLLHMGVKSKNIVVNYVPGSFELPLGAKWLIEKYDMDAAIALGCVIQGETRHFDFVCDACANGIMQVGLQTGKPAIFGVLTTNTLEQAKARAGGHHGNKGTEAAETALRMWLLQRGM
jgi:6,7-dimethyl-8-ribityllumazine synthase